MEDTGMSIINEVSICTWQNIKLFSLYRQSLGQLQPPGSDS